MPPRKSALALLSLLSLSQGKACLVAGVLFSTFQAELAFATETLEVLSSSKAAVERAAGAMGVEAHIPRAPVEIGLPTNVQHVGGGGANLLESANRIALSSVAQEELRSRALEQVRVEYKVYAI